MWKKHSCRVYVIYGAKLDLSTLYLPLCIDPHHIWPNPLSLQQMGSCCDLWNVKPFYCNSFKLWELAACYDYSATFVGGRQQRSISHTSRQNVSYIHSKKKSGWIRKTERERNGTHLDQCQIFQIESEEVISVKGKKEKEKKEEKISMWADGDNFCE